MTSEASEIVSGIIKKKEKTFYFIFIFEKKI